jgi:iron complex outermembrane recepter protein
LNCTRRLATPCARRGPAALAWAAAPVLFGLAWADAQQVEETQRIEQTAQAQLVQQVASTSGSSNVQGLAQLSLEQLGDLQVTSVAKAPEVLRHAPAAIYVITHDEIVRSGVRTVPEALRLAPNLTVTQLSASQWVVTARGFGGNPQDQNFSNKMLILIDGRSVYNPLFSGIYLDAQDLLLENIDRIEVVSGPGAALWGSNAVNGVINIITRSATATEGALAAADGGDMQKDARAQYGAQADDDSAFRVYAKRMDEEAETLADGASAHDDWGRTQAGFRYDWSQGANSLTASGDAYRALENQLSPGDLSVEGANFLTHWQHDTERSELQVLAYYDMTERAEPFGGEAFVLHTYDLEMQQNLVLGARDSLVWGAGERVNSYGVTNTVSLLFVPPRRSLTLGDLFAQNTFSLGRVELIQGLKVEDDPYAGWQFEPDLRAAWSMSETSLLWAAVSRAVRAPTPFDEDVQEKVGSIVGLLGNRSFLPETVTAYELGYRAQPASSFTMSVSTFYNIYNDLRTIEPSPVTGFFPLTWGNLMQGHTYGVELWADWQITSWWRLSPAVRTLHEDLEFKPGASGIAGVAQAGDDPSGQASLTSSMNLPSGLMLDLTWRYVAALPDPALPSYNELEARLAWQVTRTLGLSLTGLNLLHQEHLEFAPPYGEYISRSVMLGVEWQP